MERLLDRFRAAHTQVLGVSVDSVYCHANWARDLGGISFPLLGDFHLKGAVAASYGVYLEPKGITDRATVIVDAKGVVRHASSVTPAGERDIAALAGLCEEIDARFGAGLAAIPGPTGLRGEVTLYVKSDCGFSRAALLARTNLHLEGSIPVRNVSEDPAQREKVKKLSGKEQFPCLLLDGEPTFESADIIRRLVAAGTDIAE